MRARILTSAFAVVAVVLGLVIATPPPPAAALSAGVDFSADDLPTWQTNGTVWAIGGAQGKVVAGGTFSQVRPPTGGSGSAFAQNALVILDAETGAPDQCQFSMSLSGGTPTVRAVEVSADESVVYIGGNFSNVGGITVARVAALNIVDCTVLPFRAPLPSSTVTALAVHEDTLYAGGLFNSVGSNERRAFAAFDATSGALLDWTANAVRTMTNLPPEVGQARAVEVSPDGSKVVVGGDMFEINGQYSHSIAIVTAASGPNGAGGDVLRTYPNGFIPNTSVTKTIVDGGDGRFYIGNEGTGGGVFDGKAAFSWETGDQIWRDTCLGAVQDLLVRDGTIYSASHHHDCSGINAFADGIRRYFNAQNTDTMEFLGWLPLGNDGIGEGIGPRALTVATGATDGKEYLWSGGEFTRINGQAQQGLTRFGPDDTGRPPVPVIDATATSDGTVQVTFRTVVDADDDTLTYSVYRSGTSQPVWQGPAKSLWWERPQVTFVDENVTPGNTYTYRVTASDGTNTSSSSANSSAVAIAPADDYGSTLRALAPRAAWSGSAIGRWVIDSSSSSARADGLGGLFMDGAARHSGDSALASNDASFSFDGSNDYFRTEQLQEGPSTYSISAWVKTTTDRGGKIVGFGNGRPNTGNDNSRLSSNYDRHLYMGNDGRVTFGAYTGSTVTLTSSAALNDGEWHFIVGTQGPEGMRLYVDGEPAASNSTSNAQDYWGIWRVGGDQLNGWPNAPSSRFFAGLIDEVGIFPTAIGRADVASLYRASGRTLDANVAPSDAYGKAVFQDDPELYWRFDETSSTAADSSLFAQHPGAYRGSTERGVAGVIPGDTAVRTDGTTNGTVATADRMSPSSVFSAEAWFKTTTTTGGKIFGFENRQSGNGNSYDKHVYLTDDGRLIWGTNNGSLVTLASTESYNDGIWHHVVGTLGVDGRALYVDGELIAESDATGAESGNGYWRVGGGNLSGWPERPSGDYFAGTIDEFAVHTKALSASTVAAHYALAVSGADAPVAPTGVLAMSAEAGMTLTWDEPESTFGVAQYQIHRSTDPAFEVSEDTLVGTSDEPLFVDTTVTPGVVYYRLIAVGPDDNAGDPTDAIEVTVPDTTGPSAPDEVVAVIDLNDVSLTWTASTDDVAVANYEVHRGDTMDFVPTPDTLVATVTDTAYVDEARPAETVYYQVVAVDTSGNASAPSAAVEAIVPDVTAPTTPTDLVATVGGDPEITLEWTASSDDLGVVGYDVYRGLSADFELTESAKIAFVTELEHIDTGLSPATWYYRVVAVDEAGNDSPASAVASGLIPDVTAPSTATDLAATTSGDDVELTWTAASDDVAVDHYVIHRGASIDFAASAATEVGQSDTASYTAVDRPAGSEFYRVVAVDAAGNAGAASDAVEIVVPDVTAPTAPEVTALLADGAVGVSWTGSTDDVGVTGYQVHRGTSSDFSVSSSTKLADTTGAEYTDTTATAGTWFYRVVAVDEAGNASTASAAAEVVVPDTTAPTAPGELSAATSGEQVQLSWAASTDDVAVAGYEVHRSDTAGFTPAEATRVGTADTAAYLDETVVPGTWFYRVVAVDAAGNASEFSNEVSIEVLDIDDTPPAAPTDLVGTVDGVDVTLTWTAATDDVAVTGYQVHRGSAADFVPGAGTMLATTTETEYVDAGRAAGTWFYLVVAVDAAGNLSPASAAAEVTVADLSGPSAPLDVAATLSGTTASVSWTASTDDVAVTGYRVYRGATADFEVSTELLVAETTELAVTETDVPVGTWFYRVVAFDEAGNASLPSDAAEITVADTTAPSTVTGVAALPGESGVSVGWEAATDDVGVTEYRVHRGSTADFSPSAETRVATVTELLYLDAAPSGTWYYRVVAVDAAGNAGSASEAAQAVVSDTVAPTAPAGLTASATDADVELSWTASSDDVGVVGYQVFRGDAAGFAVSAETKVADVTGTSFTDADRPAGEWFYRVTAVDAAGNASAASAEASVTVEEETDPEPTEPIVLTVPVAADAMVLGIVPDNNYGSNTQLSSRGAGTSPIESFLSLELPAAPEGMVLSGAALHVRTSTDPTAASEDPHSVHLMTGSWSESTVTWNNRPTAEGALLGTLGVTASTNTAYTVALSPAGLSAVLGSTQTLRLSSFTADNVRLWSSEASYAPYRPVLELTFIPGEGTGPTPDVLAPTTPTGVTASVSDTDVALAWSASTDDVGVVDYQVHRGDSAGFTVSESSKIGEVPGTTFSDDNRPEGEWFYRIIAVDAAGNASAASAEVSVIVSDETDPEPVEPVVMTVPVVADSMVLGILPTSNHGSNTQLSSRGGGVSPIESFLSIELPVAPAGMVLTGAELQVRTSTDPTSASADTHAVHLMGGSWTESEITWNTRPTTEGALLGTLGATGDTNTAYTVTLSASDLAAVLGSEQTLRFSSIGTDNVRLWSSEASYAPYRPALVLTFTAA